MPLVARLSPTLSFWMLGDMQLLGFCLSIYSGKLVSWLHLRQRLFSVFIWLPGSVNDYQCPSIKG
jgi:hypothetical protein